MLDLILPLIGDVSIPYSPYAGNCGYWAALGVAHTYLNVEEFAKSAKAHLVAGTEEMSLSEVIESAGSIGLKPVVTSGLFSPQSATGVAFLALMDNPEEGGKHWIAVEAEGGGYSMLEPKEKTALNPELVGEKCILSVVLLRNDGYVLSVNKIISVLIGLLLFPVAFFFRRGSIK